MADTSTITQLNIKIDSNVSGAIQGLNAVTKSMSAMSSATSGASRSADSDISKVEARFRELGDIARNTSNVIRNTFGKQYSGMTTQQLQRALQDATNKWSNATTKMAGYNDKMSKGFASAYKNQVEGATRMALIQEELDNRSAGGGVEETGNKAEESGNKLSAFTDKFSTFKEKIGGVIEGAGNVANKISGIGKTATNMGKRFFNAISPLKLFNREQLKTAWSSSLLGRAFAKVTRMFRLMVTRMLIRAFISNIREGFQNIAKYSDEVNQAFSRIGQSAHTLYNSVASAFAPLVMAIAPYVTKALDFITSAFNKLGELISAITGKSYYIKAIKYNYDYAKSLDKTSKSAGKTAKKVKELKSATIGIDKLNVIEKPNKDNSNSGSGNGNGNNGVSANDMFDTKPVSKKMKKLAKLIRKIAKKLFNPIKEAWDRVGGRVIKSWKSALKDVWETIKAIGRDFLKMWSQPQTEKIFENIFNTFANIGDVVKTLSQKFREAWQENNTGLHIFENIRDIIGIITDRIEKASEKTVEWAENIDFRPLLKSIEKFTKSLKRTFKGLSGIIAGFYENVLLPIGSWVIGTGLPQLLDIFTKMSDSIEWEDITKNLDDFWIAIQPYADQFGQGLLDFLSQISGMSADTINAVLGKNGAIKNLTDTLNKGDPEKARKWGEAFGWLTAIVIIGKKAVPILKNLAKFLGYIWKVLKFLQVPAFIKGVKNFFGLFKASKLAAMGDLAAAVGDMAVSLPMLPAALEEFGAAFDNLFPKTSKQIEAFATIWNDLLYIVSYALLDAFIDLLQIIGNAILGIHNGIIWLVNRIIDALNKIPGVNIDKAGYAKFFDIGDFTNTKEAIGKLNQDINKLSKPRKISLNVTDNGTAQKTKEKIDKIGYKPREIEFRAKLSTKAKEFYDTVKQKLGISSPIELKYKVMFQLNKSINQKKLQTGATQFRNLAMTVQSAKKFAEGGFPKLGSTFIAGESGAEFVGNINGKTGVASNQEITGIREAVVDSANAQNQLLAQQNNLLKAILDKNTDVVLDGMKLTKKVNRINNKLGSTMVTT